MNKQIFLIFFTFFTVVSLRGQAPQRFTYQAVVRDANGSLVSNANVGVRFTILQGSEYGITVFTQTETLQTNANGLFTIEIGGDEMESIDWGAGPYFLHSDVDPNGGSNYLLSTVQQILSVPYAIHAHTADSIIGEENYAEIDPVFSAWNKDYNDLINLPTIPANVSQLVNDAGYLTSYTEIQVLSISNDTIYLTGGSFVKLPETFSGDYNDLINKPILFSGDYDSLTNKPTIPLVPDSISAFVNDVGYITTFSEEQVLSISNDTIYLTGGSFAKLPEGFSGDYNDLNNKPVIPSVPDSVSAFQNDVGYITEADLSMLLTDLNSLIDSLRNRIDELEQAKYRKDYTIELQVLTEGFDSTKNWFQPRVAYAGFPGEYSLIMQPWIFDVSDYFGLYHEMHTCNKGTSWSNPVSLVDSLGDVFVDDTLFRIADVNTQYHAFSNKILAIGGICRYLGVNQISPVRNTCYFSYDPLSKKYSSYKTLQVPNDTLFRYSYPGCSQWVELDSGRILQPFRMWDETTGRFYTTVARCTFDGDSLVFNEYGNILDLDRGRGLYESSLIEYKGKYYLTMRNDVNGMLSVSEDGLHYSTPIEWKFDTDSLLYSVNTQQHWVKSPWALFLVYTSSNRPESENVIRGRAPLFIAQFDEENLCLIKETERILVPNKGAQLGNFGAFDLSPTESWVVTSEATTTTTLGAGDNNARVYIAKLKWY